MIVGLTLIVHRTVSRVRAAALLHPSIVSRLANTILSAAMIARNAVGEDVAGSYEPVGV
jgi:hypothetical protein